MAALADQAHARKFRVCAFSFNTPYELTAIRSVLSPKDFEFIDLTPTQAFGQETADPVTPISSTAAPVAGNEPGWLMKRCSPDLQCDVVIYSGEFAGGFFGKYGVSLNVQEIEEASCQTRCQGLFHYPREVFLLGCNTLATKNADNRTPQQYLQVLLDHGFNRAAAERVVDLRYGPLGPSFRESLRRSFMGVPRIYGFTSVAPRGEITSPMLQRYFRRKGDYGVYLSKADRDTKPNKELLSALAGTSVVQITGLTPLEPAAADRAMVCNIYDDTRSVNERLRLTQRIFARKDFLSFVPTVEVFISRNPPELLKADDRKVFAALQKQESARKQVLEQVYALNVSALKMQLAHLAEQFEWISKAEFYRIATDGVKKLLAEQLTTEVVDITCDLTRYVPAGARLKSEEIPEQLLWHSEGFRLIDCLAPADERLNLRLLAGLDRIEESTRMWAAYALSRRLPLQDIVLKGLIRHLRDPSPAVRDRIQWIFETQLPLSEEVWAAIRQANPAFAKDLEAFSRRPAASRG